MLVLTRRVNEGFYIAGNIYVKLLQVDRNRAKIGITAPDDVRIVREEIRKKAPPSA